MRCASKVERPRDVEVEPVAGGDPGHLVLHLLRALAGDPVLLGEVRRRVLLAGGRRGRVELEGAPGDLDLVAVLVAGEGRLEAALADVAPGQAMSDQISTCTVADSFVARTTTDEQGSARAAPGKGRRAHRAPRRRSSARRARRRSTGSSGDGRRCARRTVAGQLRHMMRIMRFSFPSAPVREATRGRSCMATRGAGARHFLPGRVATRPNTVEDTRSAVRPARRAGRPAGRRGGRATREQQREHREGEHPTGEREHGEARPGHHEAARHPARRVGERDREVDGGLGPARAGERRGVREQRGAGDEPEVPPQAEEAERDREQDDGLAWRERPQQTRGQERRAARRDERPPADAGRRGSR